MLANGQEPSEIRDNFDIDSWELEAAARGWEGEARPLCETPDDAVEALIEHDIGGFMRLTMGRYSPEARREFSDQLLFELASVPYSLLGQAMAEARRKITYPERLLPFIMDFVEPRAVKLAAEGDRLLALLAITRG